MAARNNLRMPHGSTVLCRPACRFVAHVRVRDARAPQRCAGPRCLRHARAAFPSRRLADAGARARPGGAGAEYREDGGLRGGAGDCAAAACQDPQEQRGRAAAARGGGGGAVLRQIGRGGGAGGGRDRAAASDLAGGHAGGGRAAGRAARAERGAFGGGGSSGQCPGAAMQRMPARRPLPVFVDVDPGIHRTGVASPEAAVALAAEIERPRHLTLAGVQYLLRVAAAHPELRGAAGGDCRPDGLSADRCSMPCGRRARKSRS